MPVMLAGPTSIYAAYISIRPGVPGPKDRQPSSIQPSDTAIVR
jgi:hypothetical protein